MRENKVRPTDIKLHQKSRTLEVAFDDGSHFNFPCEYLRVYSPSAEVRGHGPGQEVLQLGRQGAEQQACVLGNPACTSGSGARSAWER